VQKGEVLYRGKAKSLYRTNDRDVLLVEFRDDITAFDGQKKDTLPSKGRLNAQVSAFLFRLLERNGIKTHFIDMPDESHMLVKALEMIPLEVIVRNIAAGSMVGNTLSWRGPSYSHLSSLSTTRTIRAMIQCSTMTSLLPWAS